MSSVAFVAISASAFASAPSTSAVPVVSANLQIADGQQPDKKLPPPQNTQQHTQQQKQPLQQQTQQQQPKQPLQQQTQQQQPKQPLQQQTQQQQPKQPLQQQTQQQQPKQPLQQQTQQQPKQPLQQQTQQQQPKQPLQQQTQQQQQPKQPLQQQTQQQQPKQPQQQQARRYDWTTYQPGHRPPQWQQYSQNFNRQPYEVNRDSDRHYQSQPYVQPHDWSYQRWGYGETLPTPYWVRSYWLDGYSDYGLIDPPYGYVWVRYGPDALLIDVETGQILSVMYGVFV
jgi:hypothetical protein